MSAPRRTPETALVLEALASGYGHGFDIADVTGLPSGTVYPILRRLDHAGLLRSRWEEPRIGREAGRPPRRYYELTGAGQRFLADIREHFAAHESQRPKFRPATP